MLASGAILEITASAGLIRCVITNAPDVTPEEGARCAALMDETLRRAIGNAATRGGLLFDVRAGPPVFGPKTRASLEQLFTFVDEHGWPIAVIVGPAAIQKLQFVSLCAAAASRMAKVFHEESRAMSWASRHPA